jgi:hypothetical protein
MARVDSVQPTKEKSHQREGTIGYPSYILESGRVAYDGLSQKIEQLYLEIALVCPEIVVDLPIMYNLPPDFVNDPETWAEANASQKQDFYLSHVQKVSVQLVRIAAQISLLKNKESLFLEGRKFSGSYRECSNLWASIDYTVRKHIYDILIPEAPEAKTVRHVVRHSIGYEVMMAGAGWKERLDYLMNYPGLREESCYSRGKVPGEVELEVEADIRSAYPRDIVSVVNPYTGLKVIQDDFWEEGQAPDPNPERYFQEKPALQGSFFSHSDEVFGRFNIFKDLKRVIVHEEVLMEEVKRDLVKRGLGNIPVVFEASAY